MLGIAYGDAWIREFVPAAERAGIKITAREHYVRTDRSDIGNYPSPFAG